MYLKASTAFLTALVNGVSAGTLTSEAQLNPAAGGGNIGGLRIVRALGIQDRIPAEWPATNSAIAALITPATGAIATPPGWASQGPLWLQIPVTWLPALFGPGVAFPTAGPLQLSMESIANAIGGWETALQAAGWAQATPTLSGPVPTVAG